MSDPMPARPVAASSEVARPTCSRAGCSSAATWTVNWRNPRIHSLDRVKVWHACDEHVDYLRDYLAARDLDRKSTRLNSSHLRRSRMPSSA